MFPRPLRTVRLAFHLLHLAFLAVSFSTAVWLRFSSGWWMVRDAPDPVAYAAFLLVSAALWSLFARHYELDERLLQEPSYAAWAGACLKAVLASAAAVAAVAFCYRGYSFSRMAIAIFWTLHLAITLLSAAVIFRARARITAGRQCFRIAVLGSHPGATALLTGSETVEYLDLGQEAELRALKTAPRYDEVLVALHGQELAGLPALLEGLQDLPIPVRVLLDLPGASAVSRAGDYMLADIGMSPADRLTYTLGKRAMDVALACAALLLGAPLAAAIAVAIRISSGGPILFRQVRIGCNGRHFTLYKFRTLPPAPAAVTDRLWSGTAPPEAGRLGRFLRRFGLDEWPQFWNVLRGEMSVVGPRPERPHFAEGFRDALDAYPLRHRLKGGITGWAQIHGLTGESDISWRLDYDLWYLRNWSLALDCRILLLTPLRALRPKTAGTAPPQAFHAAARATHAGAAGRAAMGPEVGNHADSF